MDDVESSLDDLRERGATRGGTLFAREEGIQMGDSKLYFCCTSGGAKRLGQIFRFSLSGGKGPRLQLFFQSSDPSQFHYDDSLTVSPNDHLIVCEDQSVDVSTNHLRGITPLRMAYPLG